MHLQFKGSPYMESCLMSMQDDMGELGLLILEKAYGRFDTGRPASLDKLQFTQVSPCFVQAMPYMQHSHGSVMCDMSSSFSLRRYTLQSVVHVHRTCIMPT